jgi:hypothetical protein
MIASPVIWIWCEASSPGFTVQQLCRFNRGLLEDDSLVIRIGLEIEAQV